MISKYNNHGFTLIELIVVVALMGILATIGFSAYTASMQSGRDNRRKLDLKNIASALQLYYSDNSKYPTQANYGVLPTALSPSDPASTPYMKILPHDPTYTVNGTDDYRYKSFGTNDQCYCLSAKLERLTNAKDETNASIDCNPAPYTPSNLSYLLFCP